MIVENLPVPFDRRVWREACTLRDAGYVVSIISPTGQGYEARRDVVEGIHIYRHPLPVEANGALGYLLEYGAALAWEFWLSLWISLTRGFDVIHACNPPDLIFLVAAPYRLFGKRFIFDHHDINPELYEAKFGRRDRLYRLLCRLERWTFRSAHVVISTNESYRAIAEARGGVAAERIFVVRSGPDLTRMRPVEPNPELKRGKPFLVGYVGVMGRQEGIDLLLDAAAFLVHELGRTDINFTLVGSGPELNALERYRDELGLEECVVFTGRVPDEVLLRVLSTADVCVNPDRVNAMNDKSTMNKIMEYMALGKPIVQFELAEGRYSAQEASLYARPNDPRDFAERIAELCDDAGKRSRMGAFGRERVRDRLAWEHEAPKLLQAYEAAFRRPAEVGARDAE